MSTVRKRRLHVWENPILHDSVIDKSRPVKVTYEHEEFDWWNIDQHNSLRIGVTYVDKLEGEQLERNLAVGGDGYKHTHQPVWIFRPMMWAHVRLEEYEERKNRPEWPTRPEEYEKQYEEQVDRPKWATEVPTELPLTEAQPVPLLYDEIIHEHESAPAARDRFASQQTTVLPTVQVISENKEPDGTPDSNDTLLFTAEELGRNPKDFSGIDPTKVHKAIHGDKTRLDLILPAILPNGPKKDPKKESGANDEKTECIPVGEPSKNSD